MPFAGDHMWKSMDQLFSITLERKMSLLVHFHYSHAVMCHQFQWGRMLLLSSLTSFLKALISVMSLICLSAFLTYCYLMLQLTTLLTLDGYMTSKILQKQPNILIATI